VTDGVFARLRPWSPRLFLAAGVGAFVFAIDNALGTYAGTSYPVVSEVVAPVGFFLGVLGLLGLSADLVPSGGTLARLARGVGVLPALTWSALIVGGIAETTGLIAEGGVLPRAFGLVTIVLMILTFVLFGATTLRTDVFSPVVGVLMLLEAIAFLFVVSRLVPVWAIDVLHTGVHLGLGGLLLSQGTQRGTADTPADSAA